MVPIEGQVRGDLFFTPDPVEFKWQLREWRTATSPDMLTIFKPDTVKR